MESAPPMGLLQRALSKRSGLGVAPKQADPLDASKHLEHIPEDALDSDVTGSSVAAVSTFLASDQVSWLCAFFDRSSGRPGFDVVCLSFPVCPTFDFRAPGDR